jgi:hypothetical protein
MTVGESPSRIKNTCIGLLLVLDTFDRTVVQLPHCTAMPRSWTRLYNTSVVAARLCFSV